MAATHDAQPSPASVHTNVLLCRAPPLLFWDVLEDMLDSCDDITTAEVGAGESIPAHIERTTADVLIIAQERLSDLSTPPLLELYPRLRVLVLVSDAREAYLHELRPTTQQLSGVSLKELIRVIQQPRATEI